MRENEADRAAARRARRAQNAEGAAKSAAAASAELSREEKRRAIRDEIPVVLRLLAAKDYPDVVQKQVGSKRQRLFRGPVAVMRAAWRIGAYTYDFKDSTLTSEIYLLSTGELGHTAMDGTINLWTAGSGYMDAHLDSILRGLQNKRRQLES